MKQKLDHRRRLDCPTPAPAHLLPRQRSRFGSSVPEALDDPLHFISLMVGDLQRIEVYAEKGFQIRDEIPDKIWNSYLYLVKSGFDKFLVKPG